MAFYIFILEWLVESIIEVFKYAGILALVSLAVALLIFLATMNGPR